jgi:hypothetical protein
MDPREGGGPQPVWRLVCAVTDEGVRVLNARQVAMTLPPTDAVEDEAERVGFWVELRDSEEQTLYRRIMADPFQADVEVPGEPGEPFTRVPADSRGNAFSILVPDLPGADHVSLIRGERPAVGTATAGPAEVGRLSLTGDGIPGTPPEEE